MYTDFINVLKINALFKGLSEEDIKSMLQCLTPTLSEYKKGEIIAMTGEKLKGVAIMLSGKADITKESLIGNRYILTNLVQGSIFAEVAMFANEGIAVATVVATQKAEVMFIQPEKITCNCNKLCEKHKILVENLFSIFANKSMLLNKKIEYLMIKSMRGRVCAFIANMYNKSQKKEINIPFNRTDLADYLGVSRPSLSRELGRMRDEGIIDFKGKQIVIKDISKITDFLSK